MSERDYDEGVYLVHRAFCDPEHELVGEWDRSMAEALRRGGYSIVKNDPQGWLYEHSGHSVRYVPQEYEPAALYCDTEDCRIEPDGFTFDLASDAVPSDRDVAAREPA